MSWLSELYRKHRKGATANNFSYSRYGFLGERINDPVYNCDVHLDKGCSHVDGMLCDMKTCKILEDHRNEQIICPVCGYYCLGKGGIGCINKPALCGLENNDE